MRYRFTVTLDVPDQELELSREDAQAYTADAVATMMGCHHPADPILQAKSVTVKGTGLTPVVREIGYTFFDPEYDG